MCGTGSVVAEAPAIAATKAKAKKATGFRELARPQLVIRFHVDPDKLTFGRSHSELTLLAKITGTDFVKLVVPEADPSNGLIVEGATRPWFDKNRAGYEKAALALVTKVNKAVSVCQKKYDTAEKALATARKAAAKLTPAKKAAADKLAQKNWQAARALAFKTIKTIKGYV